jgi:hypothetical protein
MQNGSDLLAEPVFHSNDKLLLLRDIEPYGGRAGSQSRGQAAQSLPADFSEHSKLVTRSNS